MAPINHDFEVYQGATFNEVILWKQSTGAVVDLREYTARLQVKSPTGGLIVELTTENGGINPQADGSVQLFIDDNATKLLSAGVYRYDAKFRADSNGFVTVLLAGVFSVLAPITVEEPANA